jgi:hypothetical protein
VVVLIPSKQTLGNILLPFTSLKSSYHFLIQLPNNMFEWQYYYFWAIWLIFSLETGNSYLDSLCFSSVSPSICLYSALEQAMLINFLQKTQTDRNHITLLETYLLRKL